MERRIERQLRRRMPAWTIWIWIPPAASFWLLWVVGVVRGQWSWNSALGALFCTMMPWIAFNQRRMFDVLATRREGGAPEVAAPESWTRYVRNVLLRRPPLWSIGAWGVAGLALLVGCAWKLPDGIEAWAPLGMAGFLCLTMALHWFDLRRFGELVEGGR